MSPRPRFVASVCAVAAVSLVALPACKDDAPAGAKATPAPSAVAAASASALAAAALAAASAAAAAPPEKPHERAVVGAAPKPKGLAVDASGRVLVLSVTGGDPKTSTEQLDLVAFTPGKPEPARLAAKLRGADGPVIAKNDLFVTVAGDKPTDDRLVKIPAAGGAPATVAKAWAGGEPGLASDGAGGVVYFAAPQKPDDTALDVMHLAAGGKSTKIATAQKTAKHTFLVADDKSAYWCEAGKILGAPLAGGAPVELAKVVYAWSAASDGAYLYFADSSGDSEGVVKRVPVGGGAAQTLASGFTFPIAMALDAKSVFFLDMHDAEGAVMRVPKEGGVAATIAPGQDHPKRVAVDDKFVYWTNTGEGVVARALK